MKKDYEPFVEGTVRCVVCGCDEPEDVQDFSMRDMMHHACREDPDYYDDDYDDDYERDDD